MFMNSIIQSFFSEQSFVLMFWCLLFLFFIILHSMIRFFFPFFHLSNIFWKASCCSHFSFFSEVCLLLYLVFHSFSVTSIYTFSIFGYSLITTIVWYILFVFLQRPINGQVFLSLQLHVLSRVCLSAFLIFYWVLLYV